MIGIVGFAALAAIMLMFYRLFHYRSNILNSSKQLHTAASLSKPILYVCTKCSERKRKEDTPDKEVMDMEDMAGENSGCRLFKSVVSSAAASQNSQDIKEIEVDATKEYEMKDFRIVPTRCLNMCKKANCVAMVGENKYCYQFGGVELDEEHKENLVSFMKWYSQSETGFTKTKERPETLKKNILARIPPFIAPHSSEENR